MCCCLCRYKVVSEIAQDKAGWARLHTLPPRGDWCAAPSDDSGSDADSDEEDDGTSAGGAAASAAFEGAASSAREVDVPLYARVVSMTREPSLCCAACCV